MPSESAEPATRRRGEKTEVRSVEGKIFHIPTGGLPPNYGHIHFMEMTAPRSNANYRDTNTKP